LGIFPIYNHPGYLPAEIKPRKVKLRSSGWIVSPTRLVTPLASNKEVRKRCATLQAKCGCSYLVLFVSVETVKCPSAPEIKAVSSDKNDDAFIRIGFIAV